MGLPALYRCRPRAPGSDVSRPAGSTHFPTASRRAVGWRWLTAWHENSSPSKGTTHYVWIASPRVPFRESSGTPGNPRLTLCRPHRSRRFRLVTGGLCRFLHHLSRRLASARYLGESLPATRDCGQKCGRPRPSRSDIDLDHEREPIRIWRLVGVGRFELPTSWSQTRRSNLAELHPGFSSS